MEGTTTARPPVGVPKESWRRYPELDGLRGLAILLVICHHYGLLPYLGGVNLFFVLSGFLIGGILLEKKGTPNYFKAFYARRACRILPLYFLWVAASFAVAWALERWFLPAHYLLDELFSDPFPLWSYLTFTHNFFVAAQGAWGPTGLAVTWSLAVEEQFLLLLPLLIAFVPKKVLPYALLAPVLLAPLWRVLLSPNLVVTDEFPVYAVLLPGRADSLFLGVLLAWGLREPRKRSLLTSRRSALYGVLAVSAGLVAYARWVSPLELPAGPFLESTLPLFYACLLLAAVSEGRGPVSFVGRLFPLRALAPVAFGAFLFHEPAFRVAVVAVQKIGLPPGGVFQAAVVLIGLALTFPAATVSWHLFEKRVVRWGRSWFRYQKT